MKTPAVLACFHLELSLTLESLISSLHRLNLVRQENNSNKIWKYQRVHDPEISALTAHYLKPDEFIMNTSGRLPSRSGA